MIGQKLRNRYRADKKVGAGAFGTVYRGYDCELHREVAIKVLRERDDDSGDDDRNMREIRSLARLNHPNIVTIHDAGACEQQRFIITEFVDGMTLHDLISHAPLPPFEACCLAKGICDAMAYAHEQGVVHRDLKLPNIMVTMGADEKSKIKIFDFGLAKIVRDHNPSAGRELKGTPPYMSPEQVQCLPVDGRTDIFAFGVCLFRMLSGRFPFEAEHPTAVMYKIVNEDNIIFDSETPADLRWIIERCLEKNPADRYQNFADIIIDLDRIQEECPDTAVPMPNATTVSMKIPVRGSQRNPYLNRAMIRDAADHFGREKEIRKIYSRLDAPHPQSISIVGDRRIGKSSLLNLIYQRAQRKAHMGNYRNAIFVYLDFQGSADFTVPRFIDFLFNVFSYDTEAQLDQFSGERTLDQLREAVKELHENGRRVIVLMDEFESITRNPNFDESFFSFLRSIANNFRVAYVTSSCDELQHMCHNQDISDSPFFNIFSNLPLLPFNKDEALRLIGEPSAAEGIPLIGHADRILALSGCFPLFIQIACSALFEHLAENGDTEPDWNRVEQVFIDEALPHFEFTWDRMSDAERENVTRFAEGRKISRKYEFVNENLLRRGYLVESDEGPQLFSTAFGDFILRRKQARKSRKFGFGSLFGRKR